MSGGRRRSRRRRRGALLVFAAVAAVAAVVVVVLASGAGTHAHRSRAAAAHPVTSPIPVASAPPPRLPRRRVPAPGTLPQTGQFPSSTTAAFRARMSALWKGIVSGSSRVAMPAFFPKGAYVQVKAEASPETDWSERLVGGYRLDIDAAKALLGPAAAHAQLVRVDAPSQYAHWVPPGACYSRVGYYELPNARVVYRAAGALRSLGIASMISWRGEWYVVHLGAVDRSGVVDDPEPGPGASAPSSTC